MKYEEVNEIFIEIDGVKYFGKQKITGKRVKYQYIEYKNLVEPDSPKYTPERQHRMKGQATLILSQMVKKYHNFK